MTFDQIENAGNRIDYYIYITDSTDHTINLLRNLSLRNQIIALAL